MKGHRSRGQNHSRRGFTLLEALVATAIMGIAVAGVLSALAGSSRNAARLTEYDRATLLARSKMDELLVDHTLPRKVPIEGVFDPAVTGGISAGWRALVVPYETAPGAGPGEWVVDRIELEIWWLNGTYRRSFTLDGFRRSLL
jgi:prepilin-type N-terminal cleavage/methylation domain-containing protein